MLYPALRLVVPVDVAIVVVSYFSSFLLGGFLYYPVFNFLEGISRVPETAAKVFMLKTFGGSGELE